MIISRIYFTSRQLLCECLFVCWDCVPVRASSLTSDGWALAPSHVPLSQSQYRPLCDLNILAEIL